MTTTPPPLTTQAHVEPFLAYLRSTYPDYFTSSERPSRVVDDFLTHAPERARQRSYSVTNAVKRDRDDQLPRRARRGGDAVDADALCKELDSLRTSEDVQRFVNKLLGERHEKPIHPTTHAAAAATREGGVTDITGEALGEDGNDGNPPAQPASPEVSMVAGSARRTARTSTARRRTQRKRRCWTLVGGGQWQSGNSRQSSARTAPRRKKRQKRVWRWV